MLITWCIGPEIKPPETEQYGSTAGRSATQALVGVISSMQETIKTRASLKALDKKSPYLGAHPKGLVIAVDLTDAFPSFNPRHVVARMRGDGAPTCNC